MSNAPTANNNHRVCTERDNMLSFKLSFYTHLCRYHRLPRRVHYDNRLLAPRGMCIDLFHAAYPYGLGMMYGAKFQEPIVVSCPYPSANVCVKLEVKTLLTKPLRRFIAYVLSKIGRKVEIPGIRLIMTILQGANSNCPCAYTQGTQFQFNIWQGKEVCPALFDALYPAVHNVMRGGHIPWQWGMENNEIVCPDSKSNITLALTIKKPDG